VNSYVISYRHPQGALQHHVVRNAEDDVGACAQLLDFVDDVIDIIACVELTRWQQFVYLDAELDECATLADVAAVLDALRPECGPVMLDVLDKLAERQERARRGNVVQLFGAGGGR
jgi:hypothetical protein